MGLQYHRHELGQAEVDRSEGPGAPLERWGSPLAVPLITFSERPPQLPTRPLSGSAQQLQINNHYLPFVEKKKSKNFKK